jgi:hypothetical protein
MAQGEDVFVFGAVGSGRGECDDLFDASHLGGDDRHEKRRGVGRSASGDTTSDAFQRSVALAEFDALGGVVTCFAMQNRGLKALDVFANAADGFEECWVGLVVRRFHLLGRDAECIRRDIGFVEFLGVVEDRFEATRFDIGADSLDDLNRRKWLAKNFDRFSFAGFADDAALGVNSLAKRGNDAGGIAISSIECGNAEWRDH